MGTIRGHFQLEEKLFASINALIIRVRGEDNESCTKFI